MIAEMRGNIAMAVRENSEAEACEGATMGTQEQAMRASEAGARARAAMEI